MVTVKWYSGQLSSVVLIADLYHVVSLLAISSKQMCCSLIRTGKYNKGYDAVYSLTTNSYQPQSWLHSICIQTKFNKIHQNCNNTSSRKYFPILLPDQGRMMQQLP